MIVSEFIAGIVALAFAVLMQTTQGRLLLIRRFRHGGASAALFSTILGMLGASAVLSSLWHTHPHFDAGVLPALIVLTLAIEAVWLMRSRIATAPAAAARRILAIGAHPDDLELACGASLARLVDAGHEVHAIVMSHGGVGGDASCRPAEAKAAADFLGLASIRVFDMPDTNFDLVPNTLIGTIEEAIRTVDPHVILTHSEHDQHQDHAAVHAATLRAARAHHSILCFESPSVTRNFNPDVFIDVEDYTEVKVTSVLSHRNQAGKPYMTAEVVRGITAFRGRQAKRSHAEGFEAVRLLVTEAGVL